MHANKPKVARCSIAFIPLTTIALLIPFSSACRTTVTERSGNIILNAPVTGVVRRVLVNEGASVDKDTAIIEIGAAKEQPNASENANTNSDQARAARAAQSDLAAAEAEANRASAELRRIEPLVKRGLASQAELDKARAQAQDSRERLKLARERANNPDANRNQAPPLASTEEIVAVRVPAAGTVKAISVHAGQTVTIGQPLATLVSNT
jgi:multidrug efflux pump subunit AcrA (membrane-fusion protein)